MKKRKSQIFVLFLAVLLVSVLSCKNPFLKKMLVEEEKGSESPAVSDTPAPQSPDAGSFEDTDDGFIKIIPPVNGIIGTAPSYPLPESKDYWKGVFIAGRKVKLSPYKLGKTEVTYELWYEVLAWAEDKGYIFANKGREGSHGTEEAAPTAARKKEPVTMINWRDCIVWCNAYTQMKAEGEADTECVYRKSKTDSTVLKDATATAFCDAAYADMNKKGFRLPTEAEWEYAARWQGNDDTNADKCGDVWLTKLNSASGARKPIGFAGLSLPEGEAWESLRDELTGAAVYYEWWNGTDWKKQTPKVTKTVAVGSKAANAPGLYDMSGNVWEWCFDRYNKNPALNDSAYAQDGIVTDPEGATSPASGTDAYRVFRGGGWNSSAQHCTVGERNRYSPDKTYSYLGFRLACRP